MKSNAVPPPSLTCCSKDYSVALKYLRPIFYSKEHHAMSKSLTILAGLVLLALQLTAVAVAQQPEQPDLTIDAAARTQVINGVLKRLNDSYVFPETAKKMEQSILERVRKQEYDQITSAKELATKLTNDLQEVSHDKHLRVRYSDRPIPERGP